MTVGLPFIFSGLQITIDPSKSTDALITLCASAAVPGDEYAPLILALGAYSGLILAEATPENPDNNCILTTQTPFSIYATTTDTPVVLIDI